MEHMEAFLRREIKFTDIIEIVKTVMGKYQKQKSKNQNLKLNQIMDADGWAREAAQNIIENGSQKSGNRKIYT